MDISYVHTCKRKDLGKPCSFTDVGPHLLAEVEPDPELKSKFYNVRTVDKEVDGSVKICAQEVNTATNATQNRGMNHKEGGWEASIDIEDEDSKVRFRKKTEKDKRYTDAVVNLGGLMENLVMTNNSIDVYEEYFADDRIKTKYTVTFQTASVVLDPNTNHRRVVDISWSADSSRVAGAYSVDGLSGSLAEIGVESYVWDVGNNAGPHCVLEPESCLSCVEFSPNDANLLLGGFVSGQVALWDIRVGGKSHRLSEVKESHTQAVTGVKWLATKSCMDFFSVSKDGNIMSWDARSLSAPIQKIKLSPEDDGFRNLDQPYRASCSDYNQAQPNYFLLGTEQGKILSFCRQYNLHGDIDITSYDCKCGPILKTSRNRLFPQLFASCDPHSTNLWVETNTESPVLSLTSRSGFCTDFCWSPNKASVLYVAKTTGVVEVWDILGQHFRPTTSIGLEKGALESVSVNSSGHQLACGSRSGKIHFMLIPEQYRNSSDAELSLIATSICSDKDEVKENEDLETPAGNIFSKGGDMEETPVKEEHFLETPTVADGNEISKDTDCDELVAEKLFYSVVDN